MVAKMYCKPFYAGILHSGSRWEMEVWFSYEMLKLPEFSILPRPIKLEQYARAESGKTQDCTQSDEFVPCPFW